MSIVGDKEDIRTFFDVLQRATAAADTANCNSLLAACARMEDEELADAVLAWMDVRGHLANEGTVIALARAANGFRKPHWALARFSHLHGVGITTTAGVNLLARGITTEYVSRSVTAANSRRSWMTLLQWLHDNQVRGFTRVQPISAFVCRPPARFRTALL